MAQIKRSKLASINHRKTDEAVIDSGATHLFFHSVKYFSEYRKIDDEDVQSASGVSRIVGVGKVLIPLEGGIYFDAYHAPEFGENILSVSKFFFFFFESKQFIYSVRNVHSRETEQHYLNIVM